MRVLRNTILALAAGTSPVLVAQQAQEDRHWDVEGIRDLINSRGYTFDVEENWVTRFLKYGGRLKEITGLVKPQNFTATSELGVVEAMAGLPRTFDWRTEVPGGLQPIRNQGNCGSCWAFALTAVVESLVKIKTPGFDPNYAEQTLVSNCERKYDCRGGYFDAFNYIRDVGLPGEAQDPYTARNSSCKSGLRAEKKIVRWGYIGANGKEPTIAQLKTAIFQHGPVAVDVNASFSSYASGVYNRCNTRTTDHMVTLVGWNDDGQYWIMRNSWGKSWGEEGYMRIRYTDAAGRKCNGIGRVAAYAKIAE